VNLIFIFADKDGRRRRALWRFALAAGAYFVADWCAASLARFAPIPPGFEAVYWPLLAIFLLAAFTVLLAVCDKVRERPLAAQGLDLERPWARELFLGVLLSAGMIALAVLAIALLGSVRLRAHVTAGSLRLALVELWILITAALAEEVTFRGYPFQRLAESVGAAGAVTALSGLFGAAHLGNPHASLWGFLNTVLVGVLLALAYLRTRGLWLPWGIHLGWNAALGLVFGLPVSGLTEFAVLVEGKAQGPTWLTGGDYGIEASATGTVVIGLGIVALLLLPRASRHSGTAREPSLVPGDILW